ncbi:unnamed protein product [Chondrus crispus]|uniref:aspartyl aminopeptidase n=1 Tax=Chondrus crispus TaxID=2769 RepID=R7QRX3_CHOCR|nr:unnamed protein product [Chondrus crispus]CDF40115.1 unnamed protein product [Chondrus crispus]|eukprot:XP_005710409.1 unnamed protein product [Chondrus crispus]
MAEGGKDSSRAVAEKFLKFNDEGKSPYHATAAIAAILLEDGFVPIREEHNWEGQISPGGKCFFTREGSSIIAFTVSDHIEPFNTGFTILGAHTDSPCFKVKPVSTISAQGYLQLGVECYGGGLWHTWFDRDLTVAGRVVVRDESTGRLDFRLVSIPRPILRIPNLAIHLSRNIYTDGFKPNKESETTPIMATKLAAALNAAQPDAESEKKKGANASGLAENRHSPLLLKALADELDVKPDSIVDLDLCVSDMQPAAIGGLLNEFVFAPRLDNLSSCFSAARALVGTSESTGANLIRMVACFDHEEIGSRSSHGADSPLLTDSMRRICKALNVDYDCATRRSLLVSADMAHAIHPNYANKHETNHRPALGSGLVLKTNQNQRYATSGITGLIVREAARRAGVQIQEFVVPNDKPCGSTIGPILSGVSGLRTVDVGQAQLSMHSVREMCAVADFVKVEKVFEALLVHFMDIDGSLGGTEITTNGYKA